jgi:hypothetical protein
MYRETSTPDSYFEDCAAIMARLYDLTERGRSPVAVADWRPYTPTEPLTETELEQVIAAAADLHRRFAPGNAELPECRHGVHCAALVDGVPTCVLCRVERRVAAA